MRFLSVQAWSVASQTDIQANHAALSEREVWLTALRVDGEQALAAGDQHAHLAVLAAPYKLVHVL